LRARSGGNRGIRNVEKLVVSSRVGLYDDRWSDGLGLPGAAPGVLWLTVLQDSYAVDVKGGMFVGADGVGGAAAGQRDASRGRGKGREILPFRKTARAEEKGNLGEGRAYD
jgi:hypothetical protein